MTTIRLLDPVIEQIWDANRRILDADIECKERRMEIREKVISLIVNGRYDEASNMLSSLEPLPPSAS